MRDGRIEMGIAVSHCRAKIIVNVEEIPTKKQSLSILAQCVHGCSFLQGADAHWRKEPAIAPFWGSGFFSFLLLHDRTPVCDLLFDTEEACPVLYPKLSIPYYIKERTPVDIVFLCLVTGTLYLHTHTHAIVIYIQ